MLEVGVFLHSEDGVPGCDLVPESMVLVKVGAY
jgi:hypothetical protein